MKNLDRLLETTAASRREAPASRARGVMVAAVLAMGSLLHAQPLGTAFTYQGRLALAGAPASGSHDFEFQLFDAQAAGNPVGGVVARPAVAVTSGLFTVTLDFGASAFLGQRRWLEIRVQPAGGGGYTTLSPRQELTATPNAIWSAKAGDAQTLGGTAASGYMLAGAVVPITQGGTGATDAATARASLQAARSGANSDITSLTGLITPLTIAQGGTGAATGPAALAALNAQARVTGSCPPGQYLRVVNADGTAVCGTDADTNSGGTLTNLATGAGLTGGPITATGTVSIATGGVTSSMIANGAVGAAQINTSQVQTRLAATCPGGQYLRGANADGSVVCGTFDFSPTITTVDTNIVGRYSSIAIGQDGFPVLSYRDDLARSLKVARCLTPDCQGTVTITTVDDPANGNNVGEYTSIAIGADGFPVISYFDATATALKVAKCLTADCQGTVTITTVDDPANGNNVGQYTSIAIGADGLPVISYFDFTATSLKVAKCLTADCQGTVTITTLDDPANGNNVGQYTSIAIGADGFPVISYFDATATALKVAKCLNADCTGDGANVTVVDWGAGEYNSIAIGADGFPVVSYFSGNDASSYRLKVAKCGNADCTGASTITAVHLTPVYYTSIAIGADGFPVISYLDAHDNAVNVAKCLNAACTGPSTISTFAFRGAHTSIAIGADGLPVISYEDSLARTLKVAKCGKPNCAP